MGGVTAVWGGCGKGGGGGEGGSLVAPPIGGTHAAQLSTQPVQVVAAPCVETQGAAGVHLGEGHFAGGAATERLQGGRGGVSITSPPP